MLASLWRHAGIQGSIVASPGPSQARPVPFGTHNAYSPIASTGQENVATAVCIKKEHTLETRTSASDGSMDAAGVGKVLQCIDKMCRHFLPSFDFKKALAARDEDSDGASPIERVRQRLMLLKMTVDAKFETMTVLRSPCMAS